jgi:predicted PurR-regulated permease PerM
MSATTPVPPPPEQRPSTPLWDTLIRVALIGGLAWLCFQVFSPFLKLMVWSIILAVTLYPAHQWIARRLGGRQGLTSIVLVVLAVAIIVVPTWLLMNSFADSIHRMVYAMQNNGVHVPPPRESVKNWPVVGNKVYDTWANARDDLPGFLHKMEPKLGDLARQAVSMVASVGGTMLLFLVSFVVATILMAKGGAAASTGRSFFTRVAGPTRGEALANLSIATIRAVALGVVGVAAIQALLVGLALLIAGIPVAGVLAIIVLVLGIAQVPAAVVTLPAIVYVWASGHYSTGAAIAYTILLLLTGLADNVLKPLMLGRGVDVPMPVILFGALGGMATGGILGMFVGATALALGYEIFMKWIAIQPESDPALTDDGQPTERVAI